jgi:hypothetical protein
VFIRVLHYTFKDIYKRYWRYTFFGFWDEEMDYRYNDITLEQSKMSFKEIIKEYLDKKEK